MADSLDQSLPLLQEILNSLSQSADPPQSSVSQLISFLNSTLDAALSDPDNEDAKANASRALTKVHQFVSSPSLDQAIIEALSFELPMAVSKFGGVSDGCLEVAESTIDCFISMCSPRDMLSILCEAIVSMNHNVTSSQLFVLQLSSFFPFCGLSYLGVITGSDVDKRTRAVVGEDEDDYMSCLSDVKCGAPLPVIWGHASDDVVRAAEEDLTSIKDELKNNQTERWQAVGMLKHILAPASLPWELKRYTINFLICITDGNISHYDERNDFSSFMTSLFAALQAVQMVIIYASDTTLRKNAFEAFKRILADIPASQRFDMLKSLIINSNSSYMIGILLDVVKGELHKESCQKVGNDEVLQAKLPTLFWIWTANVLELVELILKPPEGGPPSFPEDTDKVKPTTLECCPEAIYRNPIRGGFYPYEPR